MRTLHERSSKLLRARSWVWAPMAYDTWVVYCTVLVLYMAPRRHHILRYLLIYISYHGPNATASSSVYPTSRAIGAVISLNLVSPLLPALLSSLYELYACVGW